MRPTDADLGRLRFHSESKMQENKVTQKIQLNRTQQPFPESLKSL